MLPDSINRVQELLRWLDEELFCGANLFIIPKEADKRREYRSRRSADALNRNMIDGTIKCFDHVLDLTWLEALTMQLDLRIFAAKHVQVAVRSKPSKITSLVKAETRILRSEPVNGTEEAQCRPLRIMQVAISYIALDDKLADTPDRCEPVVIFRVDDPSLAVERRPNHADGIA
jgi:hypothetical protein